MTNQYLWDRVIGRDPDLRAADADRERTAQRLRTAHAEGRLDIDEFQQRLDGCFEAKTLGQLSVLVRDLPRPQEPRRHAMSRVLAFPRGIAIPFLAIVFALIVVSSAIGHLGLWLWIALAFLFWRMSWWQRRRRRWAGARRGWDDLI